MRQPRIGDVSGAVLKDALAGKPAREIVERDDGFIRVVTYCTVGNRAAQAWFALSNLLDYPNTGVYAGSWAEWGFLADTPVETGASLRAHVS
jgi:thiosulfate/3-mercaptopyruvate sulfurtransferase